MLEISIRNYYPLDKREVISRVPSVPGVLILAIQLANGVYQPIHLLKSNNLYRSTTNIISSRNNSLPEPVLGIMNNFQCYFAFISAERECHNDIVQAMSDTVQEMMI